MSANPLLWYHLADSAFPTGGYAFSAGIEAAAKLGLFKSLPQFSEYLRCNLEQLNAYDIPFINSCYRDENTETVADHYHAGMLVPSLCKASLIQGRSLLRILENLWGKDALATAKQKMTRTPDRRHFLLVYAWSLSAQNLPLEEAKTCYLYINVRDWISSAVRLGCLGPMQGHRIQQDILRAVPELLAASRDHSLHQARRNAPFVDNAQAWHQHIYSKLFQS